MEKISALILKMFRLENLAKNLTGYVETRLELFKDEIKTDIAAAVAKALTLAFLGMFAFLFILFSSIGLAYFFNSFFEGQHVGFWIVSGIYGLIFFIFLLNLKTLSAAIEARILDSSKRTRK